MHRLRNQPRDLICAQALGTPFGDRGDDLELAHVLYGAPVSLRDRGAAGDDHHGNPGSVSLGQAGQGIGETGPGGDRGHADVAGGQRPPRRHEHGVLLVAGVDQLEAFGAGSVEQR